MNSLSETTIKPFNGGKHANRTGNRLEKFVEQALIEHGYIEFWDHKEQVFANRKAVGGKQYAKQVVVDTTIYGTKRKSDFLILNKDKWPDGLIIECKWQQSKGTVDEKYPFLIFNIVKTAVPTIILIDGGGYKKLALEWLQSQADPKRALTAVWTMSDFQKKVNDGFLL